MEAEEEVGVLFGRSGGNMGVYWVRIKEAQGVLGKARGKHWGSVAESRGRVGVHSRGHKRV